MIQKNERRRYASDLSDSQWPIIEPLFPRAGNRSKWEKRELLDAVRYLFVLLTLFVLLLLFVLCSNDFSLLVQLLIPGLKAMGVTDVFDHTVSDFTPMTGDVGEVCVSEAKHAARVKIDEAGCEAAAYTVLAVRAMALMPPAEEIDFILDRPFLFAVTGADGLPLFVGVVNTPIEN